MMFSYAIFWRGMNAMGTDTKFFTNEDNNSLLERFKSTLPTTRYFDVLAGYFRSSGFGLLSDALGNVEKMRILVGLETEKSVVDAAQAACGLLPEVLASHAEIHGQYSKSVQDEFENAPENQQTEDSISQFIAFIRAGKIEIRGHPARDIHAKVYISRYRDDRDFGNVVTGSSNFTNAGLTAQREFNVQLKDECDVKFALERFEKLWNEAVELTGEFIDTATRKTWLNNSITPYELYLKFLYEYFKEDINAADGISAMLPDDFQDLEYQRQAVIAARKILDAHNGVFLADVVGLGKTFIASMLLQSLPGHKLIICPPVLKPYWEEALRTFYVHPFRVVSSGKLPEITDYAKYSYIVVDESHRFRNEKTQSYELLKKICLGKKVILLSATPLNNRLDDLLAQIKLFQKGKASTIPGVSNLEAFFRQQAKALKDLNPADKDDRIQAERVAALVRDKVLKHVMIRRTRKEVSKYFTEDIIKNGLKFPDVETPTPLIYEFDDDLEAAFNQTIHLLKDLTYARYTPLLYLTAGASQIETLSQKNIRGFIKSLLVKRLESSFFAFGLTVERIIYSYEAFIEAFGKGKVYVGKQVDIGDILDSDDLEEMEEKLTLKGVEVYNADDFDEQFLPDLQKDLAAFQAIAAIWSKIEADPKYDAFLQNLVSNETLKGERVLIFTESRETGEYLYFRLQNTLPSVAMMFSSKNALHNGQTISPRDARNIIRRNFDPSHDDPGEDFRILITTDVLAEGNPVKINALVADFVGKNRSSEAAMAALVTQYRSDCNEIGADSLVGCIDPEARPAAMVLNFTSALSAQLSSDARADIIGMSLVNRNDSVERYNPYRHTLTLLAFVADEKAQRDTVVPVLRRLRGDFAERRLAVLEVSAAADSAAWKSSTATDSATWTQTWTPGTVSSQQYRRMSVARVPFFIVADSTGRQLYRGGSAAGAERVLRDSFKSR